MIERFEGLVDEEELEMVRSYLDEEGFEWLAGTLEDAEDVEAIDEAIKEIYKQLGTFDIEVEADSDEYYKNYSMAHKMQMGIEASNKRTALLLADLGVGSQDASNKEMENILEVDGNGDEEKD